jgi:hypothetical protein
MDPRLGTAGLHQDFYKSRLFKQLNKISGEYDVLSSSLRNFFPLSRSYTVTRFYLTCRQTLQQPAAAHARCMTIAFDNNAAPFAVGTGLPLLLRVKLHVPLFSETILYQTTCLVFYKHMIKRYTSFETNCIHSTRTRCLLS